MEYYCPVCGGKTHHHKWFRKNKFDIVRCSICSMVHIEPMPTREEAQSFYQTGGVASYTKEYIEGKRKESIVESRFKQYLSILLRYASAGDCILDVGCHDGVFLKVLKDAGFEVYGQEVQTELAAIVRQKLKTTVYNEDLTMLNNEARYDFISALSVIEHAPNVEELIKKIYSLLVSRGYFLLEVPNVDSFESRLIHYFFHQTVGYWFEPTPPIHLWEFNKNTIQKILIKSGFDVIEIGTFSPFDSGDDIARYPEGYYIQREGVDSQTLFNDKRNVLQFLKENGDSNQSFEKLLTYITKKLIRTTFEESKYFEEVVDNKSAIWVLAQKN